MNFRVICGNKFALGIELEAALQLYGVPWDLLLVLSLHMERNVENQSFHLFARHKHLQTPA